MHRLVPFAPQEYYHIYNRGADKRVIFEDQADYVRFQELLYLVNTTSSVSVRDIRKQVDIAYDYEREGILVNIGAYCLMPNHFHILVTPQTDGGVVKFMSKLTTGYSMYFNRRYERSGVLFQGRYRAEHASDDRYLKYLFSYIHLNPVKLIDPAWKEKGIGDPVSAFGYATNYKYSSLSDYMEDGRPEGEILNKEAFPEYFIGAALPREELMSWLLYQ